MKAGGFESLVANGGAGNRMQLRDFLKLGEIDKMGDAGGKKPEKYSLKWPTAKKPSFSPDLAIQIGQSLASTPDGSYGAGFGKTPTTYAGYDTGRYL